MNGSKAENYRKVVSFLIVEVRILAEIKKSTEYNINTMNQKDQMKKGGLQNKRLKPCEASKRNSDSILESCPDKKRARGPIMKRTGWLAMLLAGVLLWNLTACTNGTTGTEQTPSSQSSSEDFYTVDVYALGRASEPLRKEIEERANAILEESCEAKIRLTYQGTKENCLQQVKLAVSTGKKVDLFPTFETGVAVMVNYGLITPLNGYLSLCGPEIQEDISPEDWQCVTFNGMICGVPINREKATGRGFVYRKDLAEALGYQEEDLQTIQDLEDLLLKVRDAYPEMYPVVTSSGLARLPMPYDRLGDDLGVLENSFTDSTEVVNLFETDSYRQMVELQWDWAQKGLLMPDGASNTDNEFSLMRAGKGFGHFANVKPDKYGEVIRSVGYEIGIFSIVPPYSETTLVSSMWSIGHTSEQPDKAMRVLNEMYTNPELANLLTYGIEGKTYQILDHEQNIVGFPKGIDSDNVPYGFIIWSWPNELIAHVWQKDPPDVWQQVETFNQEAHPSPARGFVWNNTEVLGEVSACNAVLDEYRNALECGSLDPAVTLPRMNQELRAAGIDKILAEKQKQLDHWLAERRSS